MKFLYNCGMKNIDVCLENLSKSKFRASFHLKKTDKDYVTSKSLEKIKSHAYDFIEKKLAPENPLNDGKQTAMRGHPVFIAQHATATCCRGCFEKWWHIPKNRKLTREEVDFAVELIMAWIEREMKTD